jgi:hypothetical protein
MAGLLWIVGISVYLFMGGLVGGVFYSVRKKRHGCYHRPCSTGHEPPAIFLGAFWMFGIPMIAGTLTAERLIGEGHRKTRHERRMEKSAVQNEGRRLEVERARLNIAYLQQNGVNADVPGLFEKGN